jgi:aspartyl-tRNA(Asn)/glutamyl-tRNA(Gln) amidotransferase subunit B
MTTTKDQSGYEAVIGLEVHAQLLTESKMFCSCSARYSGAVPNSHVCPVDLGLPGSLPVINERAVEEAIMVALALSCEIGETTKFDRKNYPYPDIPKGYQISQYDTPLGRNGEITIESESGPKTIGIIRAHMEEDTGKTIHATVGGRDVSLVDYNRSGVPLLEIVSEADMRTPDEARRYFAALREVLVYLGINSGDMQEGALRADVNVSVRKPDADYGVKVEIKNLNSFRAVVKSLEYEIERQISILEGGGTLTQETRGWDEAREATVAQRSKEYAEDYRYFPEPDLPPLVLDRARIESIRREMPETAPAMRARFTSVYGLSHYDSEILTQEPALARLLDQTMRLAPNADPKTVANWLTGEFLRLLNETGIPSNETRVTAEGLADLSGLVAGGAITNAIGKTVFEEMFRTGDSPNSIVAKRDLRQVSDKGELESVVRAVLDQNEALVSDYVNKDRKTEGPLVGKVMAATRGKANAAVVKEIIAEMLGGSD